MTASPKKDSFSQVSRVVEAAKRASPRPKISWSTRRGRRMAPRFSPETIWFTPRVISEQIHMPEDAVSKMLESDNHFVRASNIETEGNEPVYALREDYQRSANPLGRITSILVNRVVG
jgi:hypothetical protein